MSGILGELTEKQVKVLTNQQLASYVQTLLLEKESEGSSGVGKVWQQEFTKYLNGIEKTHAAWAKCKPQGLVELWEHRMGGTPLVLPGESPLVAYTYIGLDKDHPTMVRANLRVQGQKAFDVKVSKDGVQLDIGKYSRENDLIISKNPEKRPSSLREAVEAAKKAAGIEGVDVEWDVFREAIREYLQQPLKKKPDESFGKSKKRKTAARSPKGGNNPEHTLEDLLLTWLEEGRFPGLRPVLWHHRRLKFNTRVKASGIKDGEVYVNQNAQMGGIDLLALYTRAGETFLTVIELKDSYKENENPDVAIRQAIAYAVFLRELLRWQGNDPKGHCGKRWYKLLTGQEMPDGPLKILCVAAMPFAKDELAYRPERFLDNPLGEKQKLLSLGDDLGDDTLELHCMDVRWDEEAVQITSVRPESF